MTTRTDIVAVRGPLPEALKRLLSPEYLVVAQPGPLGSLWLLYLVLAILFAAGLGVALWLLVRPKLGRSRAAHVWAWYQVWICLPGLGTIVGRFLGWPGWSARIWPYSLAVLSLLGTLAFLLRRLRLPGWLAVQLSILSFSPPSDPPAGQAPDARPHGRVGLLAVTVLCLTHLAGLAFLVASRYAWPFWAAVPLFLLLLSPQLVRHRSVRRLWVGLLAITPLLLVYVAALLWASYQYLDLSVIGWQGLSFPNPMTSLFYLDAMVLAGVTFAILAQIHLLAAHSGRPQGLWRWASAGLLAATLLWAGVVYLGKRTHGATASDPYAYAQMAVDLAERGTFLHRFPLFSQVAHLDIAWAPLQPVGYHLPLNSFGDAPTVWATGASIFLALGYWLLGEVGLYVTTPLLALLALVATWALVQEILHRSPPSVRILTAALAVALTATSPEHVDRLLVPMADAPAQLFTVLTLLFLLRGMRRLGEGSGHAWEFALAGLSFGVAYWIRHTQLALAVPALLAILLGVRPARRGNTVATRPRMHILPLLAFTCAAVAAAAPDIYYRWRTFGGPLATETTELPLMALRHVGPVAWNMLREALAAGEWGYLFPIALYGAFRLARDRRCESLILGSAFALVLLIHLTYSALRLRDLISLFPLVNLAVAYGSVSLLRQTRAQALPGAPRLGARLLPAAAAGWVILSLALSRWAMIDNLWRPGWASFGYVDADQRAAFDRLAALTPAESVVASSLNAGAVTLFAHRDAVRPYDGWTEREWTTFLDAMKARRRPVYLLDDGTGMAEFIERQRERWHLEPLEELRIPVFHTRDRQTGWLYRLESIE